MKLLLVDNYDSFTYILKHYLSLPNVSVDVLRNDNPLLLEHDYITSFSGMVFSPGPGTPDEAGYMLQLIENYLPIKPILGICLGHQALGMSLGATLVHAKYPHHGVQSSIELNTHKMFEGYPSHIKVGRYHSLVLQNNSQNELYIETAFAEDNEVMAISHNRYHAWGVQFHPESCMTDDGINLIRNWLKYI